MKTVVLPSLLLLHITNPSVVQNTSKATDTTITLYSAAFCSYCTAARKILDTYAVKYQDHNVTLNPFNRKELIEYTGEVSVPTLVINQRVIKGYTELKELHDSRALKTLLEKAEQ